MVLEGCLVDFIIRVVTVVCVYRLMTSVTLSRRRRILVKFLLLEEMEDDEIVRNIYDKKGVKKHHLFELKNEELFFQNRVITDMRADAKKFTDYFHLSVQKFDCLLELIFSN